MVLSSADWVLRGGTCALVLLIAAALLRDHGRLIAARLGALFALGTASYAIVSAAGFSLLLGLWTIPLQALAAGNNVVFWALAASLSMTASASAGGTPRCGCCWWSRARRRAFSLRQRWDSA